jgi:single-strand DNA-binding protein
MGRLTREPEMRTANSGTAVCKFSLAVDRPVAKDEEKQADFINCTAFGKTAELISQYLDKGRRVAITGSLRSSSWDDPDGKKRFALEVIVERFFFADDKRKEDGVPAGASDAYEPPADQMHPAARPAAGQPAWQPKPAETAKPAGAPPWKR